MDDFYSAVKNFKNRFRKLYNIVYSSVFIIHIVVLLVLIVLFGTYSKNLYFLVDNVFIISYIVYLIFYLVQKRKEYPNLYKISLFLIYLWVIILNLWVLPYFIDSPAIRDGIFITILIIRVFLILSAVIGNKQGRKYLVGNFKLRSAQSFVIGFLLLILTGSLLLNLPVSVEKVYWQEINYVNSLFTSTSAVCVTGLIVVDTGTYFSTFGEVIILLLIQLGGLGIMTFGSFIALLVGNKMSLHSKATTLDIYDQSSFNTLKALIKTIILGTLLIELLGAIIIFLSFDGSMFNMGMLQKIYYSIFHSISAFCNAGFSLSANNLMPFVHNFNINVTVMILIVLGGIGFPVMLNLRNYFRHFAKSKIKKEITATVIVKQQTKIVLVATSLLILVGTLLFFILEWNGVMNMESLPNKIMESFFHSITTRTAGFNTVDTSILKESTYFIMIILMFIGASSGSTGGGIKTTTFFVLLSTTYSVLKGDRSVIVFQKKIGKGTVYRSIAILSSYLLIVFLATLFLTFTESFSLLEIIFEVVSAIATVGLSTGITFDLSAIGKVIITIVMFTGRIGVLTFLYLFVKPRKEQEIRYPGGTLSIG